MSRAGRPAADDAAEEIEALASLLAEVVALAEDRALFPGRWAHVAERAMEHHSVRRALVAAGSGSCDAAPMVLITGNSLTRPSQANFRAI